MERATSSPRDHAADANPDIARKKQRLADEERGASPDTSILIEADEPEDIGTNFTNAIQIEDDDYHPMHCYSEAFEPPDGRCSALAYLTDMHTGIRNHHHISMRCFADLAASLNDHIQKTADDPDEWRLHYLDEEAGFFTVLALVSICILDSEELFDPRENPNPMLLRNAFSDFTLGLQTLCRRIVPLLPEAIKGSLSRRDSVQVSSKGQELGTLYYVVLIQRLGFANTPFTDYFQRFEKPQAVETFVQLSRGDFYKTDMVPTLARLIRNLSGGVQEIKQAWPVLSSALEVFRIALDIRRASRPHLGQPNEEVEEVLTAVSACILPAACGKHPRVLPDGFHGRLVFTASFLLRTHADHCDRDSLYGVYERFVKSDTDAVIPPNQHGQDPEATLWQMANNDQSHLAHVLCLSWVMQAFTSYLRNDIMDIRNTGTALLKDQLISLYNCEIKRTPDTGLNLPITQYAIRFLRQNEITGYIFGPESRAGLIAHSADIVCFLAATNTYTNDETEIIWRACSTSVEADFVKASFSCLEALTRFLDFEQLIYIARKYATTPVDRLGADAVDFYNKLIGTLQHHISDNPDDESAELILASTFIEVVKAVSITNPSPSREELCRISMAAIMRLAQPNAKLKDRAEVYEQCIPDIKNGSPYSTASVEILTHFLNVRMQPEEVELILSKLSVADAVNELCAFVKDRSGDRQAMSYTPAVIVRLDCIVNLMSLTTPIVLEPATADKLFDHAFGNSALCNVARDQAWLKLNDFINCKAPLAAASALWQLYTQKRVPSLDARIATSALIGVIGVSLRTSFTPADIEADPLAALADPLWKALVRFASSAEDPRVVDAALNTILDLLFKYPSTWVHPPAAIVTCQCEFVRSHIESLCGECKDLIETDEAAAVRRFTRGIFILNATLVQSKEVAPLFKAPETLDVLVIGALSDDPNEAFNFVAQVYGANAQPKNIQIKAAANVRVAELIAELPQITRTAENRIIVGGREISLQPDQTLREARVRHSGVLMIRPKYTFDLDLDTILISPGPVEQVIVSQYDALDAFLDGPESIAQQAFEFLNCVRMSAQARQKVLSPTATAVDLFPKDRPWRSRISLAVLQQHLFDFITLGVADQEFISKSIRLLVAVVLDADRPFSPLVMLEVARGLCVFFQSVSRQQCESNELASEGEEQPVQKEEVIPHLDDTTQFVSRTILLIFEGLGLPFGTGSAPGRLSLRASVAKTFYRALVDSCRAHSSLWQVVAQHPNIIELHKHLLLDEDPFLSKEVAMCIRDLCRDSSVSRDISSAYWRVLVPSLPDAMRRGALSENYFSLICEILPMVSFGEDELRGMIERFSNELWGYRHAESARSTVTDQAIAGLLRVLGLVVTFLKSYKKPLNLDGFSKLLMRRLLFPSTDDPTSPPLTSEYTRGIVFNLVRWSFDPASDYDEVLEIVNTALFHAAREIGFRYPGHAEWIRSPCNAVGLMNLGMTCYMNSLLQQLFANLPFRKFIFDQPVSLSSRQNVLAQVQSLFAHMQDNTCPVINPEHLADALNVQTGNQEDVHTFYTTLLSRLEECVDGSENKTALANFFTGKSITQIKGDCGHVSSRTEPFTELSITVKNKSNLAESLAEFVQGEPLEGANKYKCMTCESEDGGRLINAVKRTCLEEVPDNLTFCLKRFTYESMAEGENKVNDRFEFPSTIDMSLYKRAYLEEADAAREPDIFELVGVIVHQGSLQFGHYWSYVRVMGAKGPQGDTWLYLEDSKALHCTNGVQEVQKQCFGGPKWPNNADRVDSAYVLFYRRRSHIAESKAMNTVPRELQVQQQALPEVQLSHDLSTPIAMANDWRQLRASFFDNSFGDFVTWLLGQFPLFLKKRISQPRATEGLNGIDVVSPGSPGRTESVLGNLIAQYASKILPADLAADTRVDSFMSALCTVVETRPTVARNILAGFSEIDGFAFANIVCQDHPKVRAQFFQGIEKCLSILREHAPQMYDEAFTPLIRSHAAIVGPHLDAARGRWGEYLSFASNIAQLGHHETGLILQQNYLTWAFEILYMRQELDLRKRHADLLAYWKVNPVDVAPLFEFIYAVLKDHVDLGEDARNPGYATERRLSTPNGWCLREDEFFYLLKLKEFIRHNKRIKIWHICLSATDNCQQAATWEEYPPGKLIGLLVSEKAHFSLAQAIEDMMLVYFDYEEERQMPMLYMALHFCLNRSDEECRQLLRQLSRNLVLWDGCERNSLFFFDHAYPLAPIAVVCSIPLWAMHFLAAKKLLSRQKTALFLCEHLFGPAPLSDNACLDALRIRTTRTIVEPLSASVQDAYTHEHGRRMYESTLETLHHAAAYLTRLQEAVAAVIEGDEQEDGEAGGTLAPEVQVEADESRMVLSGLTRVLHDLRDWEPETALPTRLLDVRKSVETESDVGGDSSEIENEGMSSDEDNV